MGFVGGDGYVGVGLFGVCDEGGVGEGGGCLEVGEEWVDVVFVGGELFFGG